MDSTDAGRRTVSDRWEHPNYDGFVWDEFGECDLIREARKWVHGEEPVDSDGLHRMIHLLRMARWRGDNLERRLEHARRQVHRLQQIQKGEL